MRLQTRQFRGPGHFASVISPKEVRKGEAEQRLPSFIANPFGCSSYEAFRRSTALEQHVLMYALSIA